METGTGLVRALIATMDAGADIINMSYGEPTTRPDVGRAIEVAAEAVYKAGVIFVASAGNAGKVTFLELIRFLLYFTVVQHPHHCAHVRSYLPQYEEHAKPSVAGIHESITCPCSSSSDYSGRLSGTSSALLHIGAYVSPDLAACT